VLEAGDGKESIRLLERNHIDVLVTDIVMPDQDGLATISIARKQRPKLKIVVISGDSPRYAELYLKTAGLMGAHKTLRKPFSISDLLQAVRETLPPTG
jgi:YesN/AraC family two-component response regulator